AMRRSLLIAIALATAACAKKIVVQAPPPAEPPIMMLYSDPRASRVGDLVTVQIMETSKGSRRVTSRADKDGELSVDLKTNTGGKAARSSMGLKTTNDTNAESGLERRGSLIANTTARVTEILPGGLLRLEGEQTIVLEGGEQTIRLKGLARPADIGPGNTILSTRLADARIEYKSRKEPSVHRRGLLAWLVGIVF
ncbi:MAG TPA: flagellar basal body L-ring protein FlgH, partial [Elusimicrobiota bacterium]|nr:flagellar basal body L-ring protein FlgH [Elusimicrobiota bacterium]